MFFIIVNIVLCAVMVATSFSIDRHGRVSNNNNSLVNIILVIASLFALMAGDVALCLWGTKQLSLLVGRFMYVVMGWFCVSVCNYMLVFPNYNKSRLLSFTRWVFYLLAVYIIFFAPGGFKNIDITPVGAFYIESDYIFKTGTFSSLFRLRWLDLYKIFYVFVIPCFTMLMVLVRSENAKNKLTRQDLVMNASGIICMWALQLFINYSETFQFMAPALYVAGFMPLVLMLIHTSRNEEIWDAKTAVRGIMRFVLRYLIPSAVCGFAFYIIWRTVKNNTLLEYGLYFAVVFMVFALWIFLRKTFHNKDFLRDNRYAANFENEITSIDFDKEPVEITNRVFEIFKKNVDTTSMRILLDSGNGYLDTIYASDNEKISVSVDSMTFDTLLNLHHQVVFREYAERNTTVSGIRASLLELLDKTNSDAFILLNEGRQILGLILLGKKASGNVYSEYDYTTFNKFYSNLFVIGYYVKNIMNEAVVGTVNREIRMSGQIITSIQENMDLIKNPKIDVGYIMVPAHNIGGEFVDMIRLTDTRHIFIIGALSGKGIAASMNMVILKSIIRTFLAETTDFKLLVEKVNSFIRESLPKGTFFSGTFGLLDFNTDTLYYINCGSPALFLYTRAYNNVIEIQGEGRILGFAKDIGHLVKVKKVKLAQGDIVMACTDGIIETRSLRGEVYGKSRAQSGLMENSGYPASKMAQFSYDSLVEFTSKELEDDITVLILKYLGGK